jgi:hypothetical protein
MTASLSKSSLPGAGARVEIFDRRTGETWTHLKAVRLRDGWTMRVRNDTTKQEVERVGRSPKFAFYDALVACGCPRDAATKAAKHFPEW